MRDINNVIDQTNVQTDIPEEVVELVVRNMFRDIQQFTSKKQGVNIQVPHVGTFLFRSVVVPNYIIRQKSTLAHWIGRMYIGQDKRLMKTIAAATNNIHKCLYNLNQVCLIKQQFLLKHARYKPRTRVILEKDSDTDMERIQEYIKNIKAEFFLDSLDPPQESDM